MSESPKRRKSKAPAKVQYSRDALIQWWKERIELIEQEHAKRIQMLRTVGEHPSPVFARQVKMFGALGLPVILVAKLLEIAPDVMMTHYGDEYELGCAEVISSVSANMIRIATSTTDPQAARVGMEILARRGGQEWKPAAQKLDIRDDREMPKNVIDSSRLTVEDRQRLREMILRAQAGEALQLTQEEPAD